MHYLLCQDSNTLHHKMTIVPEWVGLSVCGSTWVWLCACYEQRDNKAFNRSCSCSLYCIPFVIEIMGKFPLLTLALRYSYGSTITKYSNLLYLTLAFKNISLSRMLVRPLELLTRWNAKVWDMYMRTCRRTVWNSDLDQKL